MYRKLVIGLVIMLVIALALWLGIALLRSTGGTRGEISGQVGPSARLTDRPDTPSPQQPGPSGSVAQGFARLPPDQMTEPGELLVSDPPRGFTDVVQGMGFTVVETVRLEQLGLDVVRLRVPIGASGPQARQVLSARFPGVTIDAHPLYQMQAAGDYWSTARPIADWPPANESCGAGIRIGQIDAPVDISHPALAGQRIEYRSFHTPTRRPGPADHGTAVAAMLVGKPDWGGLLPGAELEAANMFEMNDAGEEVGSGLGLLRAVDWMVEKQVQVVNLSVAGGDNAIVRRAFQKARDKGLILVAAAGNWGPEARPAYPAAYSDVIAVTALDRNRNVYAKANHGSYIDFAAPGVRIYMAVPHGGRIMSGTSFATPYITVLLAVQIEAGAPKSPDGLRSLLSPRAIDLGTPGKDDVFGWGLVNLWPRCP